MFWHSLLLNLPLTWKKKVWVEISRASQLPVLQILRRYFLFQSPVWCWRKPYLSSLRNLWHSAVSRTQNKLSFGCSDLSFSISNTRNSVEILIACNCWLDADCWIYSPLLHQPFAIRIEYMFELRIARRHRKVFSAFWLQLFTRLL